MQRSDGNILYSLQIGRALAAIGVLLYHAALATRTVYPFIPQSYIKFFGLGHFGVDYFFVLSGFIIAHATRGIIPTRAAAKQYSIARVMRVYVPYLPISIVMVAVLMAMPSISMGAREHSFVASLFLLPDNAPPALSVAWTLQHEVVFYVLFGLCVFVFKRPMLIFLWLVPMVAMLFIHPQHWQYIVADILNSEFLLGIAACYAYHRRRLFAWRYALVGCGLVLVLSSFVIMFNQDHFEHTRLITGLGYACIILGCAYLEGDIDFSRFKRLIYFGTISYSLYLIHGPVISLVMRCMTGISPHWSIAFVSLCLIACVAGVLYYTLVERPLMAFANKRYGVRHVATLTAP